ncbi:MAG: hypothetical protein ACTSYO_06955 [Candidatus Ranarchaeia archaeon]
MMSHLFLVVGNSGSGKDSLITEVKKKYPKGLKPLKTPIRVITRPPSPDTEDFESVSVDMFLKLKRQGAFALDWHIYGLYYGVRKEILEWLKSGHPVLVNVSRKIIDETRKKIPGTKVIFVKVPFEVTEERIRQRGRETSQALKARLERAKKNQELPSADFTVDNTGDLEEAANKMLAYIVDTVAEKTEKPLR